MLQLPHHSCALHGQSPRSLNQKPTILGQSQRRGLRAGRASATRSNSDPTEGPLDNSEVGASWDQLMRWSRIFRTRRNGNGRGELESINKVSVLGGGSFGTAMGTALARQREDLEVIMLLRDQGLVDDINNRRDNTKYLKVSPCWRINCSLQNYLKPLPLSKLHCLTMG